MGGLLCGGVAVWGSLGVWLLLCGELRCECVGVLVCGSYGVSELWGTHTNNKKNYQTILHRILNLSLLMILGIIMEFTMAKT